MKRGFIIVLFICLSITLYQGNAGAVIGVPDVVQAGTLIVPLMEKGISSGHNTLTVVTSFCAGDRVIHWQLWDIDGNAMTGLSGNVTLGDDKQWVSDFATILAGASPSQLTQLTDGSFYRGFMTIDLVTASTALLPTDGAYPFYSFNCLTGQTYYVRLLEGAANGIPMVHIEGGVSTSLSGIDTATGFYDFLDNREEIDADARHYAYTSSNGLAAAEDPNDKIDFILSRVYVQGNGESRIVVWAWSPAGLGANVSPSGAGFGPFGFLIRSEAGAVTTNTTITLPHVVNVISVPGDTNGTAWIFDVPGAYETYAFSFNSANFSGNPAITWEAMFESTIMHEFLP